MTLRRHWQRPTKGASHRDLGRWEGARGFAPHRAFTPAEHNGYARQRHLDTGRGGGDGLFGSISVGSIFPQSFPQDTTARTGAMQRRGAVGRVATRAGRAGGQGGRAGRAGARAGRAGGSLPRSARARRMRSACRTPRPKSCPPSHARSSTLSAPGQDQLLVRSGGLCCVVNSSPGRRCFAIDGSRTLARDRRRGGLSTFACAAAFDRSAASAAPARERRRRIQPSAGAATAFDGARTSPPGQPA